MCGGGSPACLSLGIWQEIIIPLLNDVVGVGVIPLSNGDTMVLGTFGQEDSFPSKDLALSYSARKQENGF